MNLDYSDWLQALLAHGHNPALESDGVTLDVLAHDYGTHNGPRCLTCGACWCVHCREPEDIEDCLDKLREE